MGKLNVNRKIRPIRSKSVKTLTVVLDRVQWWVAVEKEGNFVTSSADMCC
jgi:hypothetical protein